MNRKVRDIIILVMSLYSLFVLVTPVIIFTKSMIFLQSLIMIIFIYLLFVYTMELKRKREGALLNMFATLILVSTSINDFLYFSQIVNTTELDSVGLVFFLFTQSISISKRYSLSFSNIEKLTWDLAFLNTSLEQQIQTRTKELQTSNRELQVANEKLTDAQQSRSRLISNISHEKSQAH